MRKITILIYLFCFGVANGYPYFFLPNEVKITARMHCQLMHYVVNDPRPITSFLLNYMVNSEPGKQIYLDDVKLGIMWDGVGTAPDMGFVIGTRWNSITRTERKKYNLAFANMLDKKYQFYNDLTYYNNCKMKIKSYKKESGLEKIVLSTTLKSREDIDIPVLYTLEKEHNYRWNIVEMEIYGTKIKALFQDKFNQILSTDGVAGMVKYIEEQ